MNFLKGSADGAPLLRYRAPFPIGSWFRGTGDALWAGIRQKCPERENGAGIGPEQEERSAERTLDRVPTAEAASAPAVAVARSGHRR